MLYYSFIQDLKQGAYSKLHYSPSPVQATKFQRPSKSRHKNA